MGRRSGRGGSRSIGGTDSLLDIIMNVIGVAFFVLIYVFLEASTAINVQRLPISREKDTEPLMFEITEREVYFLDHETLSQQLQSQSGYGTVKDETYSLRVGPNRWNPVFIYERLPTAEGTPGHRLRDPDSDFRQVLDRYDTDERHIYFLVREDSFVTFREARKVAIEVGFGAGWLPLKQDLELAFGRGDPRSSSSAQETQTR